MDDESVEAIRAWLAEPYDDDPRWERHCRTLLTALDAARAEVASMRAVVEAAEACHADGVISRPLGDVDPVAGQWRGADAMLYRALDAYRALTPSEEASDGRA